MADLRGLRGSVLPRIRSCGDVYRRAVRGSRVLLAYAAVLNAAEPNAPRSKKNASGFVFWNTIAAFDLKPDADRVFSSQSSPMAALSGSWLTNAPPVAGPRYHSRDGVWDGSSRSRGFEVIFGRAPRVRLCRAHPSTCPSCCSCVLVQRRPQGAPLFPPTASRFRAAFSSTIAVFTCHAVGNRRLGNSPALIAPRGGFPRASGFVLQHLCRRSSAGPCGCSPCGFIGYPPDLGRHSRAGAARNGCAARFRISRIRAASMCAAASRYCRNSSRSWSAS